MLERFQGIRLISVSPSFRQEKPDSADSVAGGSAGATAGVGVPLVGGGGVGVIVGGRVAADGGVGVSAVLVCAWVDSSVAAAGVAVSVGAPGCVSQASMAAASRPTNTMATSTVGLFIFSSAGGLERRWPRQATRCGRIIRAAYFTAARHPRVFPRGRGLRTKGGETGGVHRIREWRFGCGNCSNSYGPP